jgi:hypothetical protein
VSGDHYSTASARAAAEQDRLADWVARFLESPGSDNAPLGAHLLEQGRYWLGPVQVPIDRLHRLAGPPGAPVLQPLQDDEWRDDVEDLAQQIKDGGIDLPPVIVTHRDDQLMLEDGNHRVEAVRRAGADCVWAIISFETVEQRDRYDRRIGQR